MDDYDVDAGLWLVRGHARTRAATVRPRSQTADGVAGGTVDRLDDRGRAAARGWLDADESWLLADALSRYQPIRQATIAEIDAARHAPGAACSDGANHPWQLAAVVSMAAIAAERGRGAAFGWNLVPAE